MDQLERRGAVRPRGIHLHVGSQLRAVDAWRDAVRRGLAVVGLLGGSLEDFDTLDVGGGFPVLPLDEPVPRPNASPANSRLCSRRTRGPAAEAARDRAGAALVARAGWLVARVLHVRERGGRQVVLDAGAELIRPALYGAGIRSWRSPARAGRTKPTVLASSRPASRGRSANRPMRSVPTTCRRFARRPRRDRRCRRYAASPSSTYNGRPRAPRSCSRPMVALARRRADRHGWLTMSAMHRSRPALVLPRRRPLARRPRCRPGLRPRRRVMPPPAGPPFPEPIDGQAVYDYAEVLTPTTRDRPRQIIDAIEAQTKAEVVVYTQASAATTSRPTKPRPTPPPSWTSGASGGPGSTTGWSSCSTSTRASSTVRSSSTQVPVSRSASLDSRASTTTTCCRCSRAATSIPRCSSRSPRSSAARSSSRSRAPMARPASRPDRRSRSPRSTVPSTTRPASSARDDRRGRGQDRRDRAADRRRDRRLHPAERHVPDDRGDRGQGPRTDRPMGHRAGRLQRRHGHLLRHGPEPRTRAGPAIRRARVRGGLSLERRAPGDLRQRHAPAPPLGRLRRRPRRGPPEGRCRGDPGARCLAPDRPPGQRRRRTGRGTDRPARPVGLGVRQLAALRQGPGLPR